MRNIFFNLTFIKVSHPLVMGDVVFSAFFLYKIIVNLNAAFIICILNIGSRQWLRMIMILGKSKMRFNIFWELKKQFIFYYYYYYFYVV